MNIKEGLKFALASNAAFRSSTTKSAHRIIKIQEWRPIESFLWAATLKHGHPSLAFCRWHLTCCCYTHNTSCKAFCCFVWVLRKRPVGLLNSEHGLWGASSAWLPITYQHYLVQTDRQTSLSGQHLRWAPCTPSRGKRSKMLPKFPTPTQIPISSESAGLAAGICPFAWSQHGNKALTLALIAAFRSSLCKKWDSAHNTGHSTHLGCTPTSEAKLGGRFFCT